jgi:hypothetical protein
VRACARARRVRIGLKKILGTGPGFLVRREVRFLGCGQAKPRLARHCDGRDRTLKFALHLVR